MKSSSVILSNNDTHSFSSFTPGDGISGLFLDLENLLENLVLILLRRAIFPIVTPYTVHTSTSKNKNK